MSVSLDTLFTAETPEGIALALRPAGVAPRFYAFAIDLGIRFAILIAATTVLALLGRMGTGVFLILTFALEWFYPVLFELGLSGATPGKRSLGLRVVMDSGLPVTPAASLLRNLLRAADFLPAAYGFGLAAMLLRGDFKRIGDLAAGTLVVYAKNVSLHGPLPEAEPAAPARALSPRERAAVIAWAGRSARLTEARFTELAAIAGPDIVGRTAAPKDTMLRLLGVAQWLLGKR
jgi:uncharacterized RDD family membrane protein YckC